MATVSSAAPGRKRTERSHVAAPSLVRVAVRWS